MGDQEIKLFLWKKWHNDSLTNADEYGYHNEHMRENDYFQFGIQSIIESAIE